MFYQFKIYIKAVDNIYSIHLLTPFSSSSSSSHPSQTLASTLILAYEKSKIK